METINSVTQTDKNTLTKYDSDIKEGIRSILKLGGEDIGREGLVETPDRVLKLWKNFLNPEEPKITTFDSNNYDQMIVDKGIPFYSFCEHHLIPFFGYVTIGYIPDEKIIGLSKLARVVEYYSHRPNTQEYLTQNIANYLDDKLKPLGLGVKITARHLCKEMRGVKKTGEMKTQVLKGVFFKPEVREEFIIL